MDTQPMKRTRIVCDFPIGAKSGVILKQNGQVTLHGEELTRDTSFRMLESHFIYDHDAKTLAVESPQRSEIPSSQFVYFDHVWWGGPPKNSSDSERVLQATSWFIDFADQFGIDVFIGGGFFHPLDAVINLGPITLNSSDRILIGGTSRPTNRNFAPVELENVIVRAKESFDLESENGVPMIEILDKNSGEIHYFRHDMDHYWFQFGVSHCGPPYVPTFVDEVQSFAAFVAQAALLIGLALLFLAAL